MAVRATSRSRNASGSAGACPLCGREAALTFHHLIPKKLHRRNHFKKHYSREQLNQGLNICRQCHSGIHERYDEMELYRRLSTPDALMSDPALRKFFDWVSRQRISAS